MNTKKILSVVLSVSAILTAMSGCGKKQETSTKSGDYSEKFTYSMLISFDSGKMEKSETWKFIKEKFNIDIDPYYVPDANASEKARIWMATGDAPDIMRWSMGTAYDQYNDWVDQGLIRELPDLSKWPSLEQQQSYHPMDKYITKNGKRYAWVVSPKLEADGKSNSHGGGYSFYYRKDMAKELGMDKEEFTWDEFVDLARAMRDKYGKNDNTFIPWGMPKGLYPYGTGLMMYSPYWEQYYFNPETEKYEWAMDKEETTEAILFANRMFKEGIFSKDQAIFNGSEAVDKFKTGKCGILMNNVANYNTRDIYMNFEATTGLDAEECVGIARVLAPNGKAFGQYGMNYTHLMLFSPKLSDEKMERLMDLYEWLLSDEGEEFCRWGVEGYDHKVVNGKKEMINEDGSINGTNPFWAKAPVASFAADIDEEIKLYGEYIINQYEEYGDWVRSQDDSAFRRYDYTQFFCTTDAFRTHGAYFFDGSNLIQRLMPSLESEEEILAEWNAWKDSVRPNVEKVLVELDAAYAAEKAAE